MFSRVIHPVSRRSSIYFRQRIFRENSRQLSELLGRGHVRPWYRRVLPLTIVLSAGASSIPISLFIYRKYFPLDETNEENFDQNSESVSQNELDALLNQTQRLLDQEIYRTRSSAFFVPIRLFFRTIKLIFLFTPVAIFYFIQEKFAPQWFERWCFTLKRTFEYSGPCFIKLGQWMATRPDLFSDQFCSIFNDLHSNAPAHSAAETIRLLSENNIDVDPKAPADFLAKPMASGAIAQVYRCKVNSNDLVMKVRHPGVQNEIFYDLKILNHFTRFLTKVSGKTFQWMNIEENIQSFTKNMLLQTNLMIEAKNLQIFERNFIKYQKNIRFPHVDPNFPATKDILFQSYEEGQLMNDFLETCQDPQIRKKLAYLGVNAYLKMLFVDNFVHADLHPGNLLVRLDKENPSEPVIIFLDVGLTSSLTRKDKKNFYDLFRAIANYDAKEAAWLMIERAPNATEIDEPSKIGFRRDMSILIDRVIHTPLKQLEVGIVLRNVLDLGKKYHIQVDPSFTTIALGTIIIEGIGRRLDPDLDFVSAARPYLQKDFRLVKSYLNGVFQRNLRPTHWWSKILNIFQEKQISSV